MTLGDRWGAEPEPTAAESSVWSMDYVRAKAMEFQATMNALDQGYRAATDALESMATDPGEAEYLATWIADFLEKRSAFKSAAEAINLGAAAFNAAGGRLPVMSIPQTLGVLPALAVPAAIAAALGVAAGLVVWGRDALSGLRAWFSRQQLLDAAGPEQRAQFARAMLEADTAAQTAESGTLANLAPIVKWGALAVAAFLAYRVWQGSK